MTDRLAAILAHKREEVAAARMRTSQAELAAQCAGLPSTRGFRAALCSALAPRRLAVIAEAKRASPSAGQIVTDYDPAAIARGYAVAGVTALSVLTEAKFFQGATAHLQAARAACVLPVLRKDFIVDTWQVYETRALGADCMLLIVAALAADALGELAGLGMQVGLDVLVEVHDESEVEVALAAGTGLLGVNNRNLTTFKTDLAVGEQLAPLLAGDGRIVVAESAITSPADAARVLTAGADAVLVGEALMRADDPATLVAGLAQPL